MGGEQSEFMSFGVRKTLGTGIRVVAIGFFIASWFWTDDQIVYMKLLCFWAALSFLAHTIYPVKIMPWEPNYDKLWGKEPVD